MLFHLDTFDICKSNKLAGKLNTPCTFLNSKLLHSTVYSSCAKVIMLTLYTSLYMHPHPRQRVLLRPTWMLSLPR